MKDVLSDFEWPVAPRYEWQEWLDEKGKPITVPRKGLASLESESAVELLWNRSQELNRKYGPVLHPNSGEVRRYQPMDRRHAALFREFAALDHTSSSAILEFATRYGGLGLPVQPQSLSYHGRDGKLHHHDALGEPFLQWALEIIFMREGLRLSGMERSHSDSARLKWLFDRNLQYLQGRLAFTSAGDPRLALKPLTLIAAMWLQLALAVSGDKQFVACKFCGRMFEISTEDTGFRRHREFCSDSCKTKDYRKRKRTALHLARAGARLRDIAAKTGTKSATIGGWIAAAKRGRDSRAGEA